MAYASMEPSSRERDTTQAHAHVLGEAGFYYIQASTDTLLRAQVTYQLWPGLGSGPMLRLRGLLTLMKKLRNSRSQPREESHLRYRR